MFDFFVSLCLHFICATFYVWTNIFAYCDTCRIPFCNSFQINRFLSFEWVSGIIILGSKSTAVFLKFLLCVCVCMDTRWYTCVYTQAWPVYVSIHATGLQLLFNFQFPGSSRCCWRPQQTNAGRIHGCPKLELDNGA